MGGKTLRNSSLDEHLRHFSFPSLKESFGVVINEAMACGKLLVHVGFFSMEKVLLLREDVKGKTPENL